MTVQTLGAVEDIQERHPHFYENILQVVGNTPVVRLNRVTADVTCTVLAKVEFFNYPPRST